MFKLLLTILAPALAGVITLGTAPFPVAFTIWLGVIGIFTIQTVRWFEKHNRNRRRWNE